MESSSGSNFVTPANLSYAPVSESIPPPNLSKSVLCPVTVSINDAANLFIFLGLSLSTKASSPPPKRFDPTVASSFPSGNFSSFR